MEWEFGYGAGYSIDHRYHGGVVVTVHWKNPWQPWNRQIRIRRQRTFTVEQDF